MEAAKTSSRFELDFQHICLSQTTESNKSLLRQKVLCCKFVGQGVWIEGVGELTDKIRLHRRGADTVDSDAMLFKVLL